MLKHQEQGLSKMSLAAKSVKGKGKSPKTSTNKRFENSKKKSEDFIHEENINWLLPEVPYR